MCGIFGIVAVNTRLTNDRVSDMMVLMYKQIKSRGMDASGFALKSGNLLSIYKTPNSPSYLLRQPEFNDEIKRMKKSFAFIGHSRMSTNGDRLNNVNNQPVHNNDIVAIHNGIIINHAELLDSKFIYSASELDSAVIPDFLQNEQKTEGILRAARNLLARVEGVVNMAVLYKSKDILLLSSNNGSLYSMLDETLGVFLFASEKQFLECLCNKFHNDLANRNIQQLKPNESLIVNFSGNTFEFGEQSFLKTEPLEPLILDLSIYPEINIKQSNKCDYDLENEVFALRREKISKLKRCSKCILPETFPNISFDKQVVCNYCRDYVSYKLRDKSQFMEKVSLLRQMEGPNCLIALSGGRDSSYLLHYAKKVLGLNPIAFTYDWGMVTDLARRNQMRMCGKLGVEHILVSADLNRKRENVKLNVEAWLNKPDLGTIPLFMAGDKQYFHHAYQKRKANNLPLLMMGENPLERTVFKTAFSGAIQGKSSLMAYSLTTGQKIRMIQYYIKAFITNPRYLNKSLLDTITGFISYYVYPHDYVNLFDYVEWNEQEVNNVLLNEYGWEKEKDFDSTWRIGDGTAPFYNYIYYILAGFTENDTFRSNQIREGVLGRNVALKLATAENEARFERIEEYCDLLGINYKYVLRTIHAAPYLY